MSAPVHMVAVQDTMWDAWTVMVRFGVRHLVVCDGHRCAGVLDDRTLFAHWPTGPFGITSTPIREVLAPHTTCVLPETSLARVARVMVNQVVDAVPVTDVDGTILGLVTAGDIAAAVARYDLTNT
jgi:CBS domain-containing protein